MTENIMSITSSKAR